MRDQRFVAEHRGGPLSKRDHQLMALWAADCAEHALSIYWKAAEDARPLEALRLTRAWARGEIAVGLAQRAAWAAHAAARDCPDGAAKSAARAAGQAVSTAHMADHCLGAAWYGVKAAQQGGADAERERRWQDRKLPAAIRELILSARASRGI